MPYIKDWIKFFKNKEKSLSFLEKDYGKEYPYLNEKRDILLNLLKFHKEKFGNEDIIIVRAPGRINLMGRHIDHQGGHVNLIAIDQEIFITAALRNDSKVIAYNYEENSFKDFCFDFSSLDSEIEREWTDFINDSKILEKYRSSKGNWDNYIKAAFLRLINLYGIEKISGIDLCVSGNILIAAGLSSSTALTVGVFHALCKLNRIKLKDNDLLNVCSEAEWFVGTRGGCSDQVAINLARINQITYVKLFNFEILDWVEFPKKYALIIFNSQILADKSGSKKDLFNEKILAYEVGFHLFKMKFPQYSSKLIYFRDINPENLNSKSTDLMKLLLEIPEYININDLPKLLGYTWEDIEKKYRFSVISQKLPIRKTITFGISECERSKKFYNLIKNNDIRNAGKLMYISHDGDRVSTLNEHFELNSYNNEINDEKLRQYIQNNLTLDQIPGGYGASIPELDFIVDLSSSCEGVLGAQLSGAGMGGCVMILVDEKKSTEIKNFLVNNYTKQIKKKCSIFLCKPVNGLSIYSKI